MAEKGETKILAIITIYIVLILILLAGCIQLPERRYYLEGYLDYDQHLDLDKIYVELKSNNVTIEDIIEKQDKWTSEDNGNKIKGYSNFSAILFQYIIFVNASEFPIPEGGHYNKDNGYFIVKIEGTIRNTYEDDGFNINFHDHWVNLYINNLGKDRTKVTKWKPIMNKEIENIKQLIYYATNINPIEEKMEIETENYD